MKTTILGVLKAALVAAGVPALARSDVFSNVEITPTKVAGSVGMLKGAGGNIGVSSVCDGLLIVDDEFLPLADKIKAALKGIAPDGKLGSLTGYVKNVGDLLARIPADAKIKAGLPDEWESLGGGFINVDAWVETIYTSLKP